MWGSCGFRSDRRWPIVAVDDEDKENDMIDYTRSAARMLAGAFTLSIVYELYRATAMAGTSEHDSVGGFVAQLPLYAIAALVIGLLLARHRQAAWIGSAFCTLVIVISIGYYNPVVMLERQPGLVDWMEDMVFTGLMFAAAVQLLNHLFLERRCEALSSA
jgi:hypothetical protein